VRGRHLCQRDLPGQRLPFCPAALHPILLGLQLRAWPARVPGRRAAYSVPLLWRFPIQLSSVPEGAAAPPAVSCAFESEPEVPVYWEPGCVDGMLGCNADGQNMQCRHCGLKEFSHVHCPGSQVCAFPNIPTVPYYYDPDCQQGMMVVMPTACTSSAAFVASSPTSRSLAQSRMKGCTSAAAFWEIGQRITSGTMVVSMASWAATRTAFISSAGSAAALAIRRRSLPKRALGQLAAFARQQLATMDLSSCLFVG